MTFNIDYDRGVMKMDDAATGVSVYMYLDDPGRYLNAHGTEVGVDLARRAGFDVDKQVKERQLKKRLAEAYAKIHSEMQMGEASRIVVREKGGFAIRDIGLGRHELVSPDGDVLTDPEKPLPLEQANALLDQLVPDEKVEEAVAE